MAEPGALPACGCSWWGERLWFRDRTVGTGAGGSRRGRGIRDEDLKMGRKKKTAASLPADVSGEPDTHGEVNMYNKAITDKMMVALTEELVKYENKERIKLL